MKTFSGVLLLEERHATSSKLRITTKTQSLEAFFHSFFVASCLRGDKRKSALIGVKPEPENYFTSKKLTCLTQKLLSRPGMTILRVPSSAKASRQSAQLRMSLRLASAA